MSVSWPFSAPAEMNNIKLNNEAESMLAGMSLEQKVGQMIQLVATVTKTSQTELFVWRKNVKCVKCRVTFPMTADLTQFNTVPLSGRSHITVSPVRPLH